MQLNALIDEMAIRNFSFWMARSRTIFGLTRRILMGRSKEVQLLVNRSLRDHGLPDILAVMLIDRLSAPRVIFGLARRRMIAGIDTIQVLVIALMQEYIDRFLLLVGEEPPAMPEQVRPLLSHMFKREKVNPEYRKLVMSDALNVPEISIIVPFYRDARFMDAMIRMQLVFEGRNFEWIFVCDNPSLSTELTQYAKRHSSFSLQRTILLLNKANYGYSLVNAIGAEEASGEYLLFMNSDIWIDNSVPIDIALQGLRYAGFGIVGFRLLYEDGTIQHDGIRFKRTHYFHGLFTPEFPGRGLPPPTPPQKLVRPIEAVTRALMMMRRELFSALGGFSQDYVCDGFEDGDLCLKAGLAGYAIGLVDTDECYHLERQSIRPIGAENIRHAATYINCIMFNDIWGDYLERSLRGHLP
jgi:O-antigen biosynthesis protein